MNKETAVIVKSLGILSYSKTDLDMGLPQHLTECIAAEYGSLPYEDKGDVLRASHSGSKVTFGVTHRAISKGNKLTPGLHLLSLCHGLCAIASATKNLGMVIELDVDNVPTNIKTWLAERREKCVKIAKDKMEAEALKLDEKKASHAINVLEVTKS